MGLRPLEIFYSFSAGIDFRRQILTFKVDSRAERVKATLSQRLVFSGKVACSVRLVARNLEVSGSNPGRAYTVHIQGSELFK